TRGAHSGPESARRRTLVTAATKSTSSAPSPMRQRSRLELGSAMKAHDHKMQKYASTSQSWYASSVIRRRAHPDARRARSRWGSDAARECSEIVGKSGPPRRAVQHALRVYLTAMLCDDHESQRKRTIGQNSRASQAAPTRRCAGNRSDAPEIEAMHRIISITSVWCWWGVLARAHPTRLECPVRSTRFGL